MTWRFAAMKTEVATPSHGGWLVRLLLTLLIVLAATGVFGVKAFIGYPGTAIVYAAFCVVFASVLALSAMPGAPYVLVYVGLFLWLGFWAKATAHFSIDYPAIFAMKFMEPTGRFNSAPEAWDDVLLTAIAGGLGTVAAALLWRAFAGFVRSPSEELDYPAPAWYPRRRILILAGMVLAIATLIGFNEVFRILKLGWRPEVILPWPLGGLFAWSFYVGVAIVVAAVADWDLKINAPPWISLTIAFAFAWALSASIMSRSGFLFQAGPYVVASVREKKLKRLLRWRGVVLLAGMFVILFGASLGAVSYLRYMAPNRLPLQVGELTGQSVKPSSPHDLKDVWQKGEETFLALVVDRWPGLEGVMSVSSYPDKSPTVMLQAARERRSLDRVDLYTQISGSPFADEHTMRYQYAAVPGPVALLYLSGSRGMVFAGMFALVFAVILLELIVVRLLRNAFVTSLVGMYLAVLVTQLTPGLVQKASAVLTLVGLCAGLALMAKIGRRSATRAAVNGQPAGVRDDVQR